MSNLAWLIVVYQWMIAERVGVSRRDLFGLLIVMVVWVALSAWLWPPPAHADALWDFYFGPEAVVCGQFGTVPEMATMVAHRLPLSTHPDLIEWFAKHPEYRAEIDRRREYYRTHCRKE